jgi:hypothetical protein
MKLSEELLDAIDGGEECAGRDSRLTEWARQAEHLELCRESLLTTLAEISKGAGEVAIAVSGGSVSSEAVQRYAASVKSFADAAIKVGRR